MDRRTKAVAQAWARAERRKELTARLFSLAREDARRKALALRAALAARGAK